MAFFMLLANYIYGSSSGVCARYGIASMLEEVLVVQRRI